MAWENKLTCLRRPCKGFFYLLRKTLVYKNTSPALSQSHLSTFYCTIQNIIHVTILPHSNPVLLWFVFNMQGHTLPYTYARDGKAKNQMLTSKSRPCFTFTNLKYSFPLIHLPLPLLHWITVKDLEEKVGLGADLEAIWPGFCRSDILTFKARL